MLTQLIFFNDNKPMANIACPRCGQQVKVLQPIDGAILNKIREAGSVEALPGAVCMKCYVQMGGTPQLASKDGNTLQLREKAKEQKKLMLWRSRVGLVKKARACMREKAFSDAAVAYEKYFKVMEIVFDCKSGELKPEQFKDSARTQELTVVTSAYWDLLRIYDTSPNYGERQKAVAQKLSMFLKFTPIYSDIIRKANAFVKSSKNPSVIKSFLKATAASKGKCFIASSAFESMEAPEVLSLCVFRDQVLQQNSAGRQIVDLYYRHSPNIAFFLDRNPNLKPPARAVLRLASKVANHATRQF
jgi:hypothetical protein